MADDRFSQLRIEQTDHGLFHLINELVNDAVEFDLHTFAFSGGGSLVFGFDVESDNDGVRSRRQKDIRLTDRPDPGVDDLQIDLLALDLIERGADRLGRSLDIALQDNLQLFLAIAHAVEQALQGGALRHGQLVVPEFEQALFSQSASRPFRFHNEQLVSGVGQTSEAEYLDRSGGPRVPPVFSRITPSPFVLSPIVPPNSRFAYFVGAPSYTLGPPLTSTDPPLFVDR